MREKQQVLWDTSKVDQRQSTLNTNLIQHKQCRLDQSTRQRTAYNKLLLFMKERGTKPIIEERQILDGIKIILDNGWVLETEGLIAFFDILGLREKVVGISELGPQNPLLGGSGGAAQGAKKLSSSQMTGYDGVQPENLKFLEFIYLLLTLFDIDVIKMQDYFGV